ncbi:MAG TPA: hypothetical protein VNZ22_17730, partial [Bacillota bacterium]|nr:hypothetical protein [Bacillota bacterium]
MPSEEMGRFRSLRGSAAQELLSDFERSAQLLRSRQAVEQLRHKRFSSLMNADPVPKERRILARDNVPG